MEKGYAPDTIGRLPNTPSVEEGLTEDSLSVSPEVPSREPNSLDSPVTPDRPASPTNPQGLGKGALDGLLPKGEAPSVIVPPNALENAFDNTLNDTPEISLGPTPESDSESFNIPPAFPGEQSPAEPLSPEVGPITNEQMITNPIPSGDQPTPSPDFNHEGIIAEMYKDKTKPTKANLGNFDKLTKPFEKNLPIAYNDFQNLRRAVNQPDTAVTSAGNS